MGIVYRARDTLLRRTVALKFLPAELIPRPGSQGRLLDEARAASALDHPNICTIYEVGKTAGGQLYIAMACYDGETLKSRLKRGPLPIAEALDIMLQVARGLAKAHERGIVHRDIKPANLMITADGIVKILDFGIAKLPEPNRRGPLLGTPAYMSPEQARGREVDARSDIWSLGLVVLEMLGRRQPPGDERSAIEDQDRMPRAPTALRPEERSEIDRILGRMLAAEPADRYPDAAALLDDLVRLEVEIAGRRAAARSATSRHPLLALACLLMALLAAGGPWLLHGRGTRLPAAPAALRGTFTRLTDLPEGGGREWFPSLSPDGSFFVFARKVGTRSRLFLRRIVAGNALPVLPDSSADDTEPAISPDGRQLAFRSERDGGGIFVTGIPAGQVRRVTDFGFNPAWSPNSQDILCATEEVTNPRIRRHESEIYRVNLATGRRLRLYDGDAVQPSWSPHGSRIAFWGTASGRRIILTIPAGGGTALQITGGQSVDWDPVWSPDGRYLYFTSDRSGIIGIWRVPIDERSGRTLGEAEPLPASSSANMLPSLARDGRHIAYASDDSKSLIERFDFKPDTGTVKGATVAVPLTSHMIFNLDASHDGKWIVYATTEPHEDLFLVHPDGTGQRQLTDDGFKNRQPRWSPDSRTIAFYSNRGGKYDIWSIRDGGRAEKVTTIADRQLYHPVWSPDRTRLACDVGENEALIDLALPLPLRRPCPLPSPGGGLGFSASSWSADGRWLAGALHQADGYQLPGIVLYSLARGSYVRVTQLGGGPCWASDSRRLLYYVGNTIFVLDTRTGRSLQVLTPPPGSDLNDYSLSPDGRTLYAARSTDEGSIWLLTLG
jgi:Tol biopolymer transport system component